MAGLNIFQKLIEVRKSCEYLKKDNKGYQFQYVSSSQTLGTLRKAMDDNQLLLVPRVISSEIRDHETKKGEHEYFTILNMTFTWVNAELPAEQIECPWLGQGLDNGEKGVGKALTYSEKYFLLKFFNIATDKDDPDYFQKKNDPPPLPNKGKDQPRAPDPAEAIILASFKEEMGMAQTVAALNQWRSNNRDDINKSLTGANLAECRKYYAGVLAGLKAEESKGA